MNLMLDLLVIFGLDIYYLNGETWINADGTVEYCETEIFHAECKDNEVIIIQSAQYGRMRFGRCVERNYGYVGCSQDVLKIADRWCSGRRSCDIPIPNSAFRSTKPCPGDLKPYFEANYRCIPVETGGQQQCEVTGYLKVKNKEGYLARVITQDTGRGSANCPWLIEASPGQVINVTLIDFSHSGSDTSNFVHDDPGICRVTAVLREKGDTSDATTVCSGGGREKQVYTSLTNALEVRILGTKSSRELSYFLLRYEVIGCDDPSVPSDYWIRRDGEHAEIGCHNSEMIWILECVGNNWIGQYDNCTHEAAGGPLGEAVLGSILMPIKVSIVMIICIAVFMGIIILISGLICLRWRLSKRGQQKKNGTTGNMPPTSPIAVNGGNSYQQDKRASASQESFPPPPPDVDRHSTLLRDHDYSYISDLPPPPPPVGNGLNGGTNLPPPPYSAGPHPPHSPRTASTTISQSSPGSYKSYKSYMQGLHSIQNHLNYERVPSSEYTDTPPGSPAPAVPMPKLLAHECALAIRGDKTVVTEKKRHSRGQGSISIYPSSRPVSGGRRSKEGTPTYFELEPGHSTAFPFPPPPGFATISSPKNPRNQQHHQQQGIYHVRSPKKVDGKNTL